MRLVLRHAWLNLWDKHMTTGRINQVTLYEMQEQRGRRRTNPASQAKRISTFIGQTTDRQPTKLPVRRDIQRSDDREIPSHGERSLPRNKNQPELWSRAVPAASASRRQNRLLAVDSPVKGTRCLLAPRAREKQPRSAAKPGLSPVPRCSPLPPLARFARTHHTRPHIDKNTNCKRATSCYSTYRFNTYSYFFT